jgi:hypothetical protein
MWPFNIRKRERNKLSSLIVAATAALVFGRMQILLKTSSMVGNIRRIDQESPFKTANLTESASSLSCCHRETPKVAWRSLIFNVNRDCFVTKLPAMTYMNQQLLRGISYAWTIICLADSKLLLVVTTEPESSKNQHQHAC